MALQPGKYNLLTVSEVWQTKVQLANNEQEKITIKKSEFNATPEAGEEFEVFIYTDPEGNFAGTLKKPYALLGECAFLTVKEETNIGAFLDWGIEKDLYVPFSLQRSKMKEGFNYLVYVTLDKETGKLVGTSKVEEFISNEELTVEEGDAVQLLVGDHSDLGTKVIVNNKHWGLLYRNEIFKKIKKGDRVKGFVKKIRDENKLDISLQEQGYEEVFSATLKVLSKLKEEGGFLPLTDKSNPELIYKTLQMSKKTFKKAIGSLYKEKKISLEDAGIRLLLKEPK